MEAALSQWLRRYAARAYRDEMERLGFVGVVKAARGVVAKANNAELERQLREIILTHDLRRLENAARNVGADHIPNERLQSFLASKEIKVQQITSGTRWAVQDGIRRILAEASAERPRPTDATIARRIKNQFFGAGSTRRSDAFTWDAGDVLPTEVRSTDDGVLYAFSSERAALIARTELVQSENTGIMAGYDATGVQIVMWLAHRDGRSGDRHHERMHRKFIILGNLGEVFILPDGTEMRYPGDPNGPIKHLANCRCTTRAITAPSEVRKLLRFAASVGVQHRSAA